MLRIRTSAVTAAVLAIGVTAGCGGGSGTPSKQDFAKNASNVCGDVAQHVAEINRVRPTSVSDLTHFIDQLKAAVRDGINRLQALKRPKGADGQLAERFTETTDREYRQQVLPALDQLEQAVIKRDRKALRAASNRLKTAQQQKKSYALAAQLGATRCATG